jgi:hypothetical protein
MRAAHGTLQALTVAALAGVWTATARADTYSSGQQLIADCMNWRVSVGVGAERKPPEDICREVARPGQWLREACRQVGEKLAGRPVDSVACATWRRYFNSFGDPGAAVADVPDDVWGSRENSDGLRAVLERRLGKDWEQPQVQRELESIGFTCGMSRRFPSREIVDELGTPRFLCIAEVGTTFTSGPLLAHGLDIWVEVQFAEQGKPRRWYSINVTTEGMGAF